MRSWRKYKLHLFTRQKWSLLNHVFGMLACLHSRCTCVLTCSRARRACVLVCLTCSCIWRAHVLTCSHVLHACCAQISYVFLWHCLSYFLYIWKVKFQQFLYRKISFYLEKYLKPTWTSMKEFFAKKNKGWKSFIIFANRLHHRISTEVYIYFIFIDTNLKRYILKSVAIK